MNEIEKMYKNAGITRKRKCEFYEECPLLFGHPCDNCDIELTKFNSSYPPFSAEKQLELIKWLAKKKFVAYNNLGGWHVGTAQTYSEKLGIVCKYSATNIDLFEEALASLVNKLWQNLSLEEKQQVKEILSD